MVARIFESENKNENMGVLVIGGNFQSLSLIRSLGQKKVPTFLVNPGQCMAKFSRYTNRFSMCPDVKEDSLFFEYIMDLGKKENLQGWIIYPNDDETVYFLAKHKEPLEEMYRVTTPPWDTAKYAYDKVCTYKLAQKCEIAIPRTYFPKNIQELDQLEIDFPVIIKPSVKEPFYSKMKRKAILVSDRNKLREAFTSGILAVEDEQVVMVQEFIPGRSRNLFSVGSLCHNGEFIGKVVVQRPRQHPMDFGHATTYAKTVYIPELEETALKIFRAMNFSGLSEVEFMLDPKDGKYKLLEINARLWGWHSIAIKAGVDLPFLSYLDMLGIDVPRNNLKPPEVKWFRLATDVPTVLIELFMRRMQLGEYLDSLKGKKQYAALSITDPLPFIVEALMLPYLWWKRGFW
jgi:predicted ATP-grasp superfamily ATP-dependent carboligase